MSRNVIVLDAGGVLVTEPVPNLLRAMAKSGDSDVEELESFFYDEIYYPLWSGKMAASEVWSRLRQASGATLDAAYWENYFVSNLRPTTAIAELDELRSADSVVVLSNHLSRWLRPYLEEPLRRGLIDSVLISSETGHVKPDLEAFMDLFVVSGVAKNDRVLVVDDRQVNVEAAREVGFEAIVADPLLEWLKLAKDWAVRSVNVLGNGIS